MLMLYILGFFFAKDFCVRKMCLHSDTTSIKSPLFFRAEMSSSNGSISEYVAQFGRLCYWGGVLRPLTRTINKVLASVEVLPPGFPVGVGGEAQGVMRSSRN